MKKTFVLLAGFITVLSLSGCGADRTPDQANGDQDESDRAQTELVAGTYAGILNSKADGKPLGTFVVELASESRVNRGKTAVSAQITLNDGRSESTTHLPTGYYDPVTHGFRLQASVPSTSHATEILSIAGSIRGDQMIGKLEVENFPTYGGTFTIQKDADLPRLKMPNRPTDARETKAMKYAGSAKTEENVSLSARLLYTPMLRNGDQQFIDRFCPYRVADVIVYLGDDEAVTMEFPESVWDMRKSALSGIANGQMSNHTPYSIVLNCSDKSGTRSFAWHCTWTGPKDISLNVSASLR